MKYPDSLTVVRAALVSTTHGKARDWANATRTTISKLNIQPSQMAEPGGSSTDGNREAAVSGWFVYTEPGHEVDVLSTDRVEWTAVTGQLQVDGEVGVWNSPVTGVFHHQQFRIRRVAG